MIGFQEAALEHSARRFAALDTYLTTDEVVAHLRPAESVYCIYPEVLRNAAQRFVAGFPGHVLYAVKANPKPEIIRELYAAGVRHFDTASLREIALVKQLCPDAHCYFMAICKLTGAAEKAFWDYGVRHFVADHRSEVERLLTFADVDTTIHIRMKAFDPASVYELSSKFGAENDEAARLLKRVADAGLRPGLAFNVGSLCRHPDAYRRAIAAASDVAKAADVSIASIDVGGGFPTEYPGLGSRPIEEFFSAIRYELETTDWPEDCVVLCEPGRALVAEGQSLLVQVILIKEDLVFLNDGIYGSFKELDISDNAVVYPPRVIRLMGTPDEKTKPYSISGPTCDSLDLFPAKINLPVGLEVGDWIEFGLAGAYTNSMSSRFNGLYSDQWVRIEGGRAVPPSGSQSRTYAAEAGGMVMPRV